MGVWKFIKKDYIIFECSLIFEDIDKQLVGVIFRKIFKADACFQIFWENLWKYLRKIRQNISKIANRNKNAGPPFIPKIYKTNQQ